MSALLLLFACWGDKTYVVQGTVVKVSAADEVILDHEEIPGFMGPMTMPFHVKDPSILAGLEPGDRVLARLEMEEAGGYLTRVRVTGHGAVPDYEEPGGTAPLRVGQVLPATEVVLADGSTTVIGEGQAKPTALTFLYTRCPMPEFCPATVARFQALQAAAGPDVRLLALTLDPAYDTPAVLTAFAEASSADPAIWQLGQSAALEDLVLRSGLIVVRNADDAAEIVHGIRVLVLDAKGALVERYDDHDWPVERVLTQLRTGEPLGI
ncbi:MAG: copper-binding protein [Myxococcota bacterium]